MAISIHKKVLGTAASLVLVLLVAPAAYWAATWAIDGALGAKPVLGVPWTSILAGAFALIGIFWVLWAWSYLLYVGQGLPLEVFGRPLHPTEILVTTGPYAYTRNPMILGLLFVLLAVACFRGSPSGFVGIPIVAIGAWVYLAVFEEKHLQNRFGAKYEEYRRGVQLLAPKFSAIHNP